MKPYGKPMNINCNLLFLNTAIYSCTEIVIYIIYQRWITHKLVDDNDATEYRNAFHADSEENSYKI